MGSDGGEQGLVNERVLLEMTNQKTKLILLTYKKRD